MTLTEAAPPHHSLGEAPSSAPDAQLWMLETGPLPLPRHTHQQWFLQDSPAVGANGEYSLRDPVSPVAPSLLLLPALRTPATPSMCAGRPWSLCSCLAHWASAARRLPDLSCPGSSLQPPTPSLRVFSDTFAVSPPGGQLHSPSSRGQGVPPSPSSGLERGPHVGDLGPEHCRVKYTERPLVSSQTGLGQG